MRWLSKLFGSSKVVEGGVKVVKPGFDRQKVAANIEVDQLISVVANSDNNYWDCTGGPGADVIEALSNLHDPRAVDALCIILGRAFVKKPVINALDKIGDPRAVPALIKVLEWSWDSCVAAAAVLGRLGDRRAVEPLIQALAWNHGARDARRAAANALAELGEPKWKEMVKGGMGDFLRLADSGDPRVIGILIKAMIDWDDYSNEEAAEGLTHIGGSEVIEALSKVLKKGFEGLSEPYRAAAKLRVAKVLAKLHSQEALEPLIQMLDHEIKRFRVEAIKALEQLGDKRAVPALQRKVQEDRYGEGGKIAAIALESLGARPEVAPTEFCSDAEHSWTFKSEDWSKATFADDWPRCRKCGKELLAFIDALDVESTSRVNTPAFRSIMRKRHEIVINTMASDTKAHPIWQESIVKWFTPDDPRHVFTIPGGGASLVWPLLRMTGWGLWWQGGVNEMRNSYGDGHGFSLDMIWNNVGLGNDMWLA